MSVLLKSVVFLAFVGIIGLVSYAYLADLSPTTTETVVPVTLNAD
jgi:hypothetical protein